MAPRQRDLDAEVIQYLMSPEKPFESSTYSEIYRGCTIDFMGN